MLRVAGYDALPSTRDPSTVCELHRQAITAAGMGGAAAIEAERWLAEKSG